LRRATRDVELSNFLGRRIRLGDAKQAVLDCDKDRFDSLEETCGFLRDGFNLGNVETRTSRGDKGTGRGFSGKRRGGWRGVSEYRGRREDVRIGGSFGNKVSGEIRSGKVFGFDDITTGDGGARVDEMFCDETVTIATGERKCSGSLTILVVENVHVDFKQPNDNVGMTASCGEMQGRTTEMISRSERSTNSPKGVQICQCAGKCRMEN
jgi:hypothetical protein